MFRGKTAYLSRLYSRVPLKAVQLSTHMEGASPPSVFIGRMGYPKVSVGPLISNEHGDTSMMDMPEAWINNNNQDNVNSRNEPSHSSYLTAVDIINFRLQLVRGTTPVKITDVREGTKTTEMLQSIALAKNSVEVEADFSKMPTGRFLHEEVQPFGPSGPIKEVNIGNTRFEPHMEKAFHDTDLLSRDAVVSLYEKNLPFSAIQKAFSTGAFGLAKNRKLVPTRWSITAVDDMLGLHLLEKVKTYPVIDNYRVYEHNVMNNKFVVLLMPTEWQYEFLEAFIEVFEKERMLFADREGHDGRKTYSEVGGCYYSTRLALAEKMMQMRKQAGAIVFRESYSGYVPLGVWLVRETMRAAMKHQPVQFDDMRQALAHIFSGLRLPAYRYWKESSFLKRPGLFRAAASR
jgi:hypothetical protein